MKRVLVVDDAVFMRSTLIRLLESNGFEIAGQASDGMEAVEAYKKLKPDIVTMDITMPVMSGLDALLKIKAFDPGAKVVMITALGNEHMLKEAIEGGAVNFVVKPFQESKVIEVLKRI